MSSPNVVTDFLGERLESIETQIAEQEEALGRLKADRETVRGLIAAARKLPAHGSPRAARSGGRARGVVAVPEVKGERYGPAESIMRLVRERPGLSSAEIAETLKDHIKTGVATSSGRRVLVLSSVNNMVNRERLAKDLTGGIVLGPKA